jgi:hypothetical protein
VKVVKKMRIVDYDMKSMKLDLSQLEKHPAAAALIAENGAVIQNHEAPAETKKDDINSKIRSYNF